jgi:hypothetical protein
MCGMARVVAMYDRAQDANVVRSVSTPAWVGLRAKGPAIHPALRYDSPHGSGIRVVMSRTGGRVTT